MPHVHHAINYIEFNVRDMVEAKAFLSAAFGWRFNDYGPGYAGIQHHDGVGEIGGLDASAPAVPGGPLVILFSADLDASFATVKKLNAEITKEPFDFPGGRRFQFRDPSGNELGVWAER